MSSIAINVLLNPDPVTEEKARAANARLRENDPDGFALDANHTPHVTILQCFVRLADLDKVANAVTAVLRADKPMNWRSKATSYDELALENLGLVGIVIEPTDDLRRLQQKIIDDVASFALETVKSDAFAPRPDGAAISQHTVGYAINSVGTQTGIIYRPHLTVGIGTRHCVDALKAEPFEAFTFRALAVSLYQVGDFNVAQKKLYELHSC